MVIFFFFFFIDNGMKCVLVRIASMWRFNKNTKIYIPVDENLKCIPFALPDLAIHTN